jgi:hypothetical protein
MRVVRRRRRPSVAGADSFAGHASRRMRRGSYVATSRVDSVCADTFRCDSVCVGRAPHGGTFGARRCR